MSAAVEPEKWADWCEYGEDFSMCGTRMVEHTRRADGKTRWCFHCRKRRDFEFVMWVPDGLSYYGPNAVIRCVVCETADGDLFPGYYREWAES